MTRSGSTADCPRSRGQSSSIAPATSLPEVKQLPKPDEPLVGPDDQQRVQVLLRLVPLRPAAVHGAARERADVDRRDLHTRPLGCAQDIVPSLAPG